MNVFIRDVINFPIDYDNNTLVFRFEKTSKKGDDVPEFLFRRVKSFESSRKTKESRLLFSTEDGSSLLTRVQDFYDKISLTHIQF